MYFVESEDFVYGDDFNNNGVVDSRENDNKPDYPYERDSKGQHVFFTFNPTSQLELRLGGHAIDQIAGSGRNRSLYAKLEYSRPLFHNIHLNLRHRSKRVQDDIPDPLYQYVSNPLLRGRYEIGLRDDPLRYRNSHAHLKLCEIQLHRRRSLDAQQYLALRTQPPLCRYLCRWPDTRLGQ